MCVSVHTLMICKFNVLNIHKNLVRSKLDSLIKINCSFLIILSLGEYDESARSD